MRHRALADPFRRAGVVGRAWEEFVHGVVQPPEVALDRGLGVAGELRAAGDAQLVAHRAEGDQLRFVHAGVRRRGNVTEAIEKFSVIKTLQAIDDANVVVLVLDGSEKIVDQDAHIAGFILEEGRALVVAVNKWDDLPDYEREMIKVTLVRSPVGTRESHRATVRGLGLRKINSISELEDTPAVRGMINKISYLVKVL